MTIKTKGFSFVIDSNGSKLAPTTENKAWYLVRKSKATLINKIPMVIRLNKKVKNPKSEIHLGIDDGSKNVGLALVQKCKNKNKVVFKGVMEQRKDVSNLMELRKIRRRYKRYHKKYRQKRINNRASNKKDNRVPPSILQKRQAIIRFVNKTEKWVTITEIHLEDVAVDIRKVINGSKLYGDQYSKPTKLNGNIRKATLLRDNYKCMDCEKKDCKLQVHHIVPKRKKGPDSLQNLITLCCECHKKTFGREEDYIHKYKSMIEGKQFRTDHAQHVMIGKTWLRKELKKIAKLKLTTGGDTSDRRNEWGINKSHANDAVVITGLKPSDIEVKEWIIKPIRKRSKAKHKESNGIKHRDLVSYTNKKGIKYVGYVTALYPHLKAINIKSKVKHLKKVNAKKSKLIWRFKGMYFL